MSKTIGKAGLKELAERTHEVFDIRNMQDIDAKIQRRTNVAMALAKATDGVDWLNLLDLTASVFFISGEDDMWEPLCKVLEVLGWTVTDEGGNEE